MSFKLFKSATGHDIYDLNARWVARLFLLSPLLRSSLGRCVRAIIIPPRIRALLLPKRSRIPLISSRFSYDRLEPFSISTLCTRPKPNVEFIFELSMVLANWSRIATAVQRDEELRNLLSHGATNLAYFMFENEGKINRRRQTGSLAFDLFKRLVCQLKDLEKFEIFTSLNNSNRIFELNRIFSIFGVSF